MKTLNEYLSSVTERWQKITDNLLFAIIKPGFIQHKKAIKEMITATGYFSIVRARKTTLSKEQAAELYTDKKKEDYFDGLVKYMSSGPCIIMKIKDNGTAPHPIKDLIRIKEECREKYAKSPMKNCLHSSDSFKNAEREIKICFT